ncbi:MAG TPA: hypothetical protein V6D02_08285 [Candidatus Obscuribacterales bacterium]
MVMLKKSLTGLLMGVALTVGLGAVVAPAIAQSTLDPAEGFGTDDDGADVFGDSSSPYELIHRAILAPTMSADEFQENQNRALTTEAQDFLLRQQEAIRQQQNLEAGTTEDLSIDGDAL